MNPEKNVLVIEDDLELLDYIAEVLEDDFFVVKAESGERGVVLANELMPDLIMVDLSLPGISGHEVCRQLKRNEATNHIPLVVLTALSDENNLMEGLGTGVVEYLTKPFSPKELRARLVNLHANMCRIKERFGVTALSGAASADPRSESSRFLQKVVAIIKRNIDNPAFDVNFLAREVGFSRRQLQRKLKTINDQTPNELIKDIRLETAASLLKGRQNNVADVCFSVGFENPSYFSKSFREKYKMSPREFMAKHRS
ncbi:Response regulator [Sulfidibacter corallicola]|uniref:Response regulator n=1 Tax=Sulfidibacter corallicola TaxID=2818388 RepID=A0A8A4TIX2_SULCO|nr:DNA-binding response regulator [Sulfidibacter corallicola]QTD48748.1 response regulator [Sulfidibacter corallicola]